MKILSLLFNWFDFFFPERLENEKPSPFPPLSLFLFVFQKLFSSLKRWILCQTRHKPPNKNLIRSLPKDDLEKKWSLFYKDESEKMREKRIYAHKCNAAILPFWCMMLRNMCVDIGYVTHVCSNQDLPEVHNPHLTSHFL